MQLECEGVRERQRALTNSSDKFLHEESFVLAAFFEIGRGQLVVRVQALHETGFLRHLNGIACARESARVNARTALTMS